MSGKQIWIFGLENVPIPTDRIDRIIDGLKYFVEHIDKDNSSLFYNNIYCWYYYDRNNRCYIWNGKKFVKAVKCPNCTIYILPDKEKCPYCNMEIEKRW